MILVFRVVLLIILAILWLIFGLTVCIFRPFHKGNIYCLTQMLRCGRWAIGVKVDSRIDVKAIREQMPAVMVGNHQFNWDIIVMADVPQPGTACIGKKSLMFAPIFGLLFFLTGNIFIERDKSSKAGNEILKIVDVIKKKKKFITRSLYCRRLWWLEIYGVLKQTGRRICSPETALVIIPSSS